MPAKGVSVSIYQYTVSAGLCLALFNFAFNKAYAADGTYSADSQTLSYDDQTEHIVVRHQWKGFPTAYGPVGKEAGGGLIKPQTESKGISTVSSAYIQREIPTGNAFNFISLLPGANVSTSDPFGISPQTDITVRGMTDNAMGYVLEGMPLNDISDGYGYPNQFIDSENYESISLAPGTADLDSPVINAAGGVINMKMHDPAQKAGVLVNLSYGSYHTSRAFARVETGEIGKTGIRGFISYSYTDGDSWRGTGSNHRQHIDFKFTKDWGKDNKISLFGNWNYAMISSYYTPTKDEWKANGIKNDSNYTGTWDKLSANNANYWKLYQQTFRLFYMAAPAQFTLNDELQLTVTPYFQYGYGNSPYGTTLNANGNWQGMQPVSEAINIPGAKNNTATVMGDWLQRTYRSGFTPELHWRIPHHHVVLGYWYDYSDNMVNEPYTPVNSNGKPWDLWGGGKSHIRLPDGKALSAGGHNTITQINAIFIGDHMDFMDHKLFVDAGFKQVLLSRVGWNHLPGPQYRTGMNVSKPLPRLGLRYQFTPEHQLFASVSTNFAVPHESTLYDTYDPSSGSLSHKGSNRLKTEYSIEEELGYRYNGPRLIGSITFFNYNYTNRLISTILRENGAWVGSSINAGGQTSRGVDVELGLKPWHHFSPYVSAEYLHATMDNDFATNGDLLPTKGKRAVRSPPWQTAIGLTYDNGKFFATGNVKVTGPQYSTFMNDERLGTYATGNLAFGYRLPDLTEARHPEIRLNFINITDQKYRSGITSPTSNAHAVTGKYGTKIAGSSPYYYVGGGFAAMFTVTSAF